jgi:hypothetical protein
MCVLRGAVVSPPHVRNLQGKWPNSSESVSCYLLVETPPNVHRGGGGVGSFHLQTPFPQHTTPLETHPNLSLVFDIPTPTDNTTIIVVSFTCLWVGRDCVHLVRRPLFGLLYQFGVLEKITCTNAILWIGLVWLRIGTGGRLL